MLDFAKKQGASYLATGHYVKTDGKFFYVADDLSKDQSYFLHAVNGREIAKTLFPVGELEKPQVRAKAAELGLATARKKDSTGICFIGERRFRDFLKNTCPHKQAIL